MAGHKNAEQTSHTSQKAYKHDLRRELNGKLFVCVEVLRPCQQLRSYRAGQLPINTVPLVSLDLLSG